MSSTIPFPKRRRGRPSADDPFVSDLGKFADHIIEIRSTLDFTPSVRGWCYLLEELAGLTKDRFREVEQLITNCRKDGLLPLDITAKDGARSFENEEAILIQRVNNMANSVHQRKTNHYSNTSN